MRNIITNPVYEEQVYIQNYISKRGIKIPEFKNQKEAVRFYAENVSNTKNPKTGRINYIGEPNKPAHTVSPYVPHFNDNIEEGIKKLVNLLCKNGYLTVSSCEGHGHSEIRYVTIVFGSLDSLNEFIRKIGKPLKYFLNLNIFRNYINTQINHYDYGISVKRVEQDSSHFPDYSQNVDYVNAVFYRNYTNVYFLKISIGYDIKFKNQKNILLEPILLLEDLIAIIVKKLFVKLITTNLENKISSNQFPKYSE